MYSVYGATDAQRRPDAGTMAGLDVIVYDIADVGVRFYTYETTLGYLLEAAAKAGKAAAGAGPAKSHDGRVCAGAGGGRGARIVCELLADSGAARDDDG